MLGSLACESSHVTVRMGWRSLENFAACALTVLPPRGRPLREGNGSCRGMTGREILSGAAQMVLVEI